MNAQMNQMGTNIPDGPLDTVHGRKGGNAGAGFASSAAAFIITAALIIPAKLHAPVSVLIADRFFPGAGWAEIVFLSAYAALLTNALIRSAAQQRIRRRIWTLFSVVFFAQLLLGLSGADIFFMTGQLHVPVPAVIIGGPLYRGGGMFMPVLFVATLVIVGPAWCSYLCYFGAWDNLACRAIKRPGIFKPWMRVSRFSVLVLVIAAALLMRYSGISPGKAAIVALVFGAGGICVMIGFSRRMGVMAHCLVWCPLGLVAGILGKISPFRLRIAASCDACGACRNACRYGALESGNIAGKRPGFTCSLCGDCVSFCGKKAIHYRFLGLRPDTARRLFIILVISFHAAFLGLARI